MVKATLKLFSQAGQVWQTHNAPRLGAALAFYTVLSLAPLLIVAVSVAGVFFSQMDVQDRIIDQVQLLVGEDNMQVETLLRQLFRNAFDAYSASDAILPSLIGLAALLFGASIVFNELRQALNTIWEVKGPDAFREGVVNLIRNRLVALAMVAGIGFLLLVSLVLSTGATAFSSFLSQQLAIAAPFVNAFDILVSIAIVSLLFSLLYKYLPSAKVSWWDTWLGAAVTAVLFSVGKWLISMYLSRSVVASAYGAAGSLVIFLLWVYFSAQIFFFGAAFCRVYAERHGSRSFKHMDAKAKAKARVKQKARAKQAREQIEPQEAAR